MSISFTCPHCGATSNVADQYAGQSGPCAHCGKAITVPLVGGETPLSSVGAPPPKRGIGTGWTVTIVLVAVLAVALVCGGILVALLLPAVQAAREAARRAQCSNHMKQISLAMLNYESQYRCFPPAFTTDQNGKPMHSWRVLLLPYMEQQGLYDKIRLNEPWDSPHNSALASQMPSIYVCPSEGLPANGRTSYAMLVGPHAFSTGPKGRKMSEIRDGASNTLMVAEAADTHINWMEPRDLDTEHMRFQINGSRNPGAKNAEIFSRHSGGANVGFCDGSVRFLSNTTDPKTVEAMTTVDGGEVVMPPNF